MTGLPKELERILTSLPGISLAFSGGIDSRFLAHAALLCGCDILAINVHGPHIDPADSEYARRWAARRGLPFAAISVDPLSLPEVAANSRERCYGCKKEMLAAVAACSEQYRVLCDGGNADDEKSYRPGLKAAREAGVISPLALAGLDKKEIRRLAAATGLENPGQPSRACLLTRLAYGLRPEKETLEKICHCEMAISQFLESKDIANADFRIRFAPEPILQIKGNAEEVKQQLTEIMANFGFTGVKILADERISGFFDRPPSSMLE